MIVMTMGTNNEKYITEAWIENRAEEEFKKDFLTNLLQEMGGHTEDGSGINADMVDGHHYDEIINYIDNATDTLVTNFKIGGVTFDNEEISARRDYGKVMKLGFDAIHLYIRTPDGTGYEDDLYYPDFALLPWDEGYEEYTRDWETINKDEGPNLLEVFEDLYKLVLGWKEDFEDDVAVLKDLNDALDHNVNIIRNEDNEIIGSEINATSINGIRVFIMGKAEYEALDDNIKNDIHNLFIIKENENGFDDYLKARQPNTAVINKYYEFKVDVDETDGIRYLYYKHQDLDTWNKMCKASDFVDQNSILNPLLNLLQDSTSYVLNPTALLASLDAINYDSANNSLTRYIKNNGIDGARFKLDDTDASYQFCPMDSDGTGRYLTLTNLSKAILQDVGIDSVKNQISSIQGSISSINSLNSQQDSKITSNTNLINSLNSQLGTLSEQLTSLDERIDNLGEWKMYELPGYPNYGEGQFVRNYYNETTKLAYIRFSFSNSFKQTTEDSWCKPQRKNTIYNFPYTMVKAKPKSHMVFENGTHPFTTKVQITPAGALEVRIQKGTNGAVYFGGGGLYPYESLYPDEELVQMKNKN